MRHRLEADVVRGQTQTLVHLVGAIDVATIPDLRRALEPEILPSATVILDLAGVRVLSSDGSRVINEAQQALHAIGEHVVVWRPHPFAETVLRTVDAFDVRHGPLPRIA